MNKIKRDLSLGHAGEKRVIELYDKFGFISHQNADGKLFSDWDIHSNYKNIEFTTEVKWDIYAVKSGNIAIEIYNPKSDKNSGLMATKANLWAHITDYVYLTSVEKLKKFVDTEEPLRTIKAGGDNNATLLLFSKDHILSIFTKLDNLNPNKAIWLITGLINK
jgi:hypothetical protein